MFTLPLGILAVLLVTYFSLDVSNTSIYLNLHSGIIVFFGTIAVFILSVPRKDIVLTFRSLRDLLTRDSKKNKIKDILISLSKNKLEKTNVSDLPLVEYAMRLWEQGVDKDSFEYLIAERNEELFQLSERPVIVFKNLAKYPPALGMTGTVMGMISLFANLSAENKSDIGQALALAMTATFYGLILANMLLLPLSDRLQIKHQFVSNRNEDILNALCKINSDDPVALIEVMNLEQKFYEQAG